MVPDQVFLGLILGIISGPFIDLPKIYAIVSLKNAIKKVKSSRDGKPKEKTMSPTTVPYYR